MTNWLEQVQQYPVDQVANVLGLQLMRSNSLGPCPSCGLEQRAGKGGQMKLQCNERGSDKTSQKEEQVRQVKKRSRISI